MTNAFPIALPMCFDPETKLLNLRYVTQSLNGFNVGVGESTKMLEYLNQVQTFAFCLVLLANSAMNVGKLLVIKFETCQLISHTRSKKKVLRLK